MAPSAAPLPSAAAVEQHHESFRRCVDDWDSRVSVLTHQDCLPFLFIFLIPRLLPTLVSASCLTSPASFNPFLPPYPFLLLHPPSSISPCLPHPLQVLHRLLPRLLLFGKSPAVNPHSSATPESSSSNAASSVVGGTIADQHEDGDAGEAGDSDAEDRGDREEREGRDGDGGSEESQEERDDSRGLGGPAEARGEGGTSKSGRPQGDDSEAGRDRSEEDSKKCEESDSVEEAEEAGWEGGSAVEEGREGTGGVEGEEQQQVARVLVELQALVLVGKDLTATMEELLVLLVTLVGGEDGRGAGWWDGGLGEGEADEGLQELLRSDWFKSTEYFTVSVLMELQALVLVGKDLTATMEELVVLLVGLVGGEDGRGAGWDGGLAGGLGEEEADEGFRSFFPALDALAAGAAVLLVIDSALAANPAVARGIAAYNRMLQAVRCNMEAYSSVHSGAKRYQKQRGRSSRGQREEFELSLAELQGLLMMLEAAIGPQGQEGTFFQSWKESVARAVGPEAPPVAAAAKAGKGGKGGRAKASGGRQVLSGRALWRQQQKWLLPLVTHLNASAYSALHAIGSHSEQHNTRRHLAGCIALFLSLAPIAASGYEKQLMKATPSLFEAVRLHPLLPLAGPLPLSASLPPLLALHLPPALLAVSPAPFSALGEGKGGGKAGAKGAGGKGGVKAVKGSAEKRGNGGESARGVREVCEDVLRGALDRANEDLPRLASAFPPLAASLSAALRLPLSLSLQCDLLEEAVGSQVKLVEQTLAVTCNARHQVQTLLDLHASLRVSLKRRQIVLVAAVLQAIKQVEAALAACLPSLSLHLPLYQQHLLRQLNAALLPLQMDQLAKLPWPSPLQAHPTTGDVEGGSEAMGGGGGGMEGEVAGQPSSSSVATLLASAPPPAGSLFPWSNRAAMDTHKKLVNSIATVSPLLVTSSCLPPVPVSPSCHPFLSPLRVTRSCLPFVSPVPVSPSCHPFLSPLRVTLSCLSPLRLPPTAPPPTLLLSYYLKPTVTTAFLPFHSSRPMPIEHPAVTPLTIPTLQLTSMLQLTWHQLPSDRLLSFLSTACALIPPLVSTYSLACSKHPFHPFYKHIYPLPPPFTRVKRLYLVDAFLDGARLLLQPHTQERHGKQSKEHTGRRSSSRSVSWGDIYSVENQLEAALVQSFQWPLTRDVIADLHLHAISHSDLNSANPRFNPRKTRVRNLLQFLHLPPIRVLSRRIDIQAHLGEDVRQLAASKYRLLLPPIAIGGGLAFRLHSAPTPSSTSSPALPFSLFHPPSLAANLPFFVSAFSFDLSTLTFHQRPSSLARFHEPSSPIPSTRHADSSSPFSSAHGPRSLTLRQLSGLLQSTHAMLFLQHAATSACKLIAGKLSHLSRSYKNSLNIKSVKTPLKTLSKNWTHLHFLSELPLLYSSHFQQKLQEISVDPDWRIAKPAPVNNNHDASGTPASSSAAQVVAGKGKEENRGRGGADKRPWGEVVVEEVREMGVALGFVLAAATAACHSAEHTLRITPPPFESTQKRCRITPPPPPPRIAPLPPASPPPLLALQFPPSSLTHSTRATTSSSREPFQRELQASPHRPFLMLPAAIPPLSLILASKKQLAQQRLADAVGGGGRDGCVGGGRGGGGSSGSEGGRGWERGGEGEGGAWEAQDDDWLPDDGFTLGVAFLLTVANQRLAFDSIYWLSLALHHLSFQRQAMPTNPPSTLTPAAAAAAGGGGAAAAATAAGTVGGAVSGKSAGRRADAGEEEDDEEEEGEGAGGAGKGVTSLWSSWFGATAASVETAASQPELSPELTHQLRQRERVLAGMAEQLSLMNVVTISALRLFDSRPHTT
ncbi:unnamed protein product [Closterium sp. Naga37s-1]|nr:unnamed protein product [Closterium sp. Naga37s-1]